MNPIITELEKQYLDKELPETKKELRRLKELLSKNAAVVLTKLLPLEKYSKV